METTGVGPQAIPPQGIVMQMVMGGWIARAVSDISRLNIPDILKANGPMTAVELVKSGVQVNPSALERVMRVCASLGLFTESAQAQFGPTQLSDTLTADSPVSVKVIAQEVGGTWLKIWGNLAESITTGEPQARAVFGLEWWDYLNANPKELETFGEAMKSNSLNSLKGVLEHCDFSNVNKVADIAGGFGHLVVALLQKYPTLRGVLMDVPELIPVAQKRFPVSDPNLASRLQYFPGDMFASVPRSEVYVLKHIIHDWDDEHCVRVLKNCHASMEGNGRIVCVDSVIPPMGDTGATSAKLLDILMMLAIRGKERTLQQWTDLYAATGFKISKVLPLNDNFGTSIIEGIKQ
jgi:hypothetical protein